MELAISLLHSQESVTNLSWARLIQTTATLFPKFHFNIILPRTPTPSKWLPPFMLFNSILYAFLISRKRSTFLAHLILLDLDLILFGEAPFYAVFYSCLVLPPF